MSTLTTLRPICDLSAGYRISSPKADFFSIFRGSQGDPKCAFRLRHPSKITLLGQPVQTPHVNSHNPATYLRPICGVSHFQPQGHTFGAARSDPPCQLCQSCDLSAGYRIQLTAASPATVPVLVSAFYSEDNRYVSGPRIATFRFGSVLPGPC